jgi:ADP-ribose pyrophosphatase YjhB (NUDIX family)
MTDALVIFPNKVFLMNLHYNTSGAESSAESDAAGVFLFYGESVLLCKRCMLYEGAEVHFGGYWSPFTGTIEKGESAMITAIRELEEESGLKINIFSLKYIKEIQRGNSCLTLYAHELSKHFCPLLDAEHTEFGYFRINDLHLYPTPIDDEIKEAVKFYASTLRLEK